MPEDRIKKSFARLTWEKGVQPSIKSVNLKTWSEIYPSECSSKAPLSGRLILGDNLPVMQALLPEYENQIQLIYADPPFLTGKVYRARIGQNEDSRKPDEWKTIKSYQDKWRDGGE